MLCQSLLSPCTGENIQHAVIAFMTGIFINRIFGLVEIKYTGIGSGISPGVVKGNAIFKSIWSNPIQLLDQYLVTRIETIGAGIGKIRGLYNQGIPIPVAP